MLAVIVGNIDVMRRWVRSVLFASAQVAGRAYPRTELGQNGIPPLGT
jgi:hypothetical protein